MAPPSSRTTMLLLLLLQLLIFANAHTWIEAMNVISSNGTFVGPLGFARGNVLRTAPGFEDGLMVNLIPPDGRPTGNQILATDPMCMITQNTQNQTDGSPRLQAAPGSAIALRYQENGHVTLPQNQPGKPDNRGTIFVYGTTQPNSNDTLLAIHKVWNAAGTGGDKRGVLLSTQNFDDEQCYQQNAGTISAARQKAAGAGFVNDIKPPDPLMGSNLWCQQNIALPTNAPVGKPYTLYWVWDWPTLPGIDPGVPQGKNEIYTTCMDVDVIQGNALQVSSFSPLNINVAAISSEFLNLGNPTAVTAPSGPASTGSAAASSIPVSSHTFPDTSVTAGAPSGRPKGGQSGGGITQTIPGAPSGAAPDQVTTAALTALSSAAHRGPPRATVTEYDSVTETVFHTIYPSVFNGKRTMIPVAVTSLPTASTVVPENSGEPISEKAILATSTSIATPITHCATYKLRGRNPFFILPASVRCPQTSTPTPNALRSLLRPLF